MNFLVLTAHDYRTPRKANMHFIADQLAKRGTTRFLSLRYSHLSRRTNDARAVLDDGANRVERFHGVDCFLWKALVHPFNTRRRGLRFVEDWMFRWSRAHVPTVLAQWIRDADVVFIESGSAIVYSALAERLRPKARRIYIASDDLDVIEVADFVKREFERVAPRMDALCLPSPLLAARMPPSSKCFFVPHGLDRTMDTRAGPNPYSPGRHAISVGSMLFDRTFFESAGPAFPDVTFHVIGSGLTGSPGFTSNVRVYGEMPHDETLGYIKHADFGIAPYAAANIPPYLTDTSMKLMQYSYFGVPAVCPSSVAGAKPWRFGYEPGSAASIARAIDRALASGPFVPPPELTWSEVTDRLIDPEKYADTKLDGDALVTSRGPSVRPTEMA